MKKSVTQGTVTGVDAWLVMSMVALVFLGLLMVTSASMVIAKKAFHQPFHYLFHQLVYLTLGIMGGGVIFSIKNVWWERWSKPLLVAALLLLLLVLVPGIGHTVNGSRRWISLGIIGFQASELAKLFIIVYVAGYLVRHEEEVRHQVSGFLKPMAIIGIAALLLLSEPDFGTTVVITATVLGMMFLAGVRLWQFGCLLGVVLGAFALLAVASPYRLARLTTFLNPWANQFDSGYQLTQSLIAFGRGGWWGMGLGNSIQKLFYLPEAHTDFVLAVLGEELGLVGIMAVMALYTLLISRLLLIAYKAQQIGKRFAGFVCYGIALCLALQVMINMGVNAGLLPTKGLTLPLLSAGGSSLLTTCLMLAMALRVDYEVRWGS